MKTNKNYLIDFGNSEIAFRDKSNFALHRAHLLFKVMNSATCVNIGKFMVNLAFSIRFPVKAILRDTIYKQFVGGMSIEDCAETIEQLARRNVGSILDFAVEGESSEALFDVTCDEIVKTIDYAHLHKSVPFSVFKITGIGRFDLLAKISNNEQLTSQEKDEFERVRQRARKILEAGYKKGVPVLVDAEETWIQPVLDDLVLEMMGFYNKEKAIVQNTYQMYCVDSTERLKKHHQMALDKGFRLGLKIVRGAYMEKERERAKEMGYPSPIHPDKASTDAAFDDIIHYLVNHADTIDFMVATHNQQSLQLLASLMNECNLPTNLSNVFCAQLYGMSDNLTFNLADNGYNTVKYVPYGEVKTMMPYLFRRAEENTAMKGQSSRELELIRGEIRRRKTKGRAMNS